MPAERGDIKNSTIKCLIENSVQTPIEGYIYLFSLPGDEKYLKIGFSKTPRGARIEEHRKCYPKLRLIALTPSMKNVQRIESLIHKELEEYKQYHKCNHRNHSKHREWFAVDLEQAKNVVYKWTRWASHIPYAQTGDLSDRCKSHLMNLDLSATELDQLVFPQRWEKWVHEFASSASGIMSPTSNRTSHIPHRPNLRADSSVQSSPSLPTSASSSRRTSNASELLSPQTPSPSPRARRTQSASVPRARRESLLERGTEERNQVLDLWNPNLPFRRTVNLIDDSSEEGSDVDEIGDAGETGSQSSPSRSSRSSSQRLMESIPGHWGCDWE